MAFVKSVLLLAGSGGLAYVLLLAVTPKDSDLKELPAHYFKADPNQRSAFVEALKEAANKKKSMINEKQSSQTPSTPNVIEK